MKMTSWSLPSSKKSIVVDAIGELELLGCIFSGHLGNNDLRRSQSSLKMVQYSYELLIVLIMSMSMGLSCLWPRLILVAHFAGVPLMHRAI